MPLGNFACPNFTLANFFCPTQAAVSPATAEVARAIYYNGRADGVSGLEAVAHVIQNRMAHPSYPQDAASVVRLNASEFSVPQNATMAHSSTMDRRLIDHARRLATMLVNAPHRLSSQDPTAGALYISSAGLASGTDAAAQVTPPVSGGAAAQAASSSAANRTVDPQGLGCLRGDRGNATASNFGMIRLHVAMPGSSSAHPQPEGPATAMDLRSRNVGLGREGETAGGSSASAASSSTPATGLGSNIGPGGTVPTLQGNTAAMRNPTLAFSESWDMPRSRQPGLPLRPPLPGRSSRIALAGAMGERLGFGGREVDADGYHDMMLPCGLFQDEVIDIMYRDLTPEDFERLCKLDERLPKRNTVQRTTVDRLTRLPARSCSSTECRVCLGEFDPNSMVVQLPCNHAFHPSCISKWLTQCKDTCPLCAAPIEPPAGKGPEASGERPSAPSSSTAAASGSAPQATQATVLRHGEHI
mmetsp:Transcript_52104/g.124100  ORF Transcript_52104/g.124100 Transcript_52104/m.124100 type:complete len:472 (-) Transcript_52104:54-1469(-)